MKRLLFSFLFVLTAIAGWAQTEFTVGNFKYTVTDEVNYYVSVSQNSENAPSGAVVIPSSVTYETVKYTVTSIADYGFYWNEDITEVTIPNTVTSIGQYAFSSCSKLTTITLPSTLTTIGNFAFYGCSSLASFSVPGSVTTIGSMVFDYCSIPTFTFEASNTAITCNAVIPCTDHLFLYRDVNREGSELTTGAIKALTIGAHVTTIYNNMFNGSQYLNSIDFSEATGLTSIGDYAFYNCGNYVPTEPGEDPVPNLTTIDLSNTKVTSIGENAFNSCSKLTTITLPSTLTTIGNYAFYGCSSLASFSVPGSVTTIGSMVFDYCSIPTFTFEASNTAITCSAIIPCTNLYLGRDITFTEYGFSGVSALTIGTNVTSIGSLFFYSDITSVTVPWSSPITIDDDAFSDETFTKATLWIPGGTKAAYEAADGWKKFANMDFSSFIVSITGSAHGTLEVGEISSTNGEEETTLFDRGEDAVFTVTPATGYKLNTFTVNDVAATPTEGSYTVEDLSADQTVVAAFTPITYTLTYTMNGGTATPANPDTYTIETTTFTLTNPTRTGYDFAGWKLNGEGDAIEEVTIEQGSTGHLAYTATWTPINYTISYELAGGSVASANPTSYNIESAPITLINPTKDGYDFAGWTGTGLDAATKTVIIATGNTGNRSYTATWTKKTYSVSITGGGVTADNNSPEYGDNVVLTIMDDPDATLTSLTVNGTEVKESIVDHQYTITSVSGNISVVAIWSSTKEFIILAQGVGTFSCSQDLNFTGSELKAYIAAGYNKAQEQVLLVRVYDVPASTGLYLKGEAGVTYKIPYATSQAYYVNMLKANLVAGPIAQTSDDMSNFLLNKKNGNYGFFAPKESATLGAQKAYLQLPTSFVPASARAISLAFEDDETTNINDFEMFTNSNDRLYNLKGQRIEKAGRGIYIKNGKKVVIK